MKLLALENGANNIMVYTIGNWSTKCGFTVDQNGCFLYAHRWPQNVGGIAYLIERKTEAVIKSSYIKCVKWIACFNVFKPSIQVFILPDAPSVSENHISRISRMDVFLFVCICECRLNVHVFCSFFLSLNISGVYRSAQTESKTKSLLIVRTSLWRCLHHRQLWRFVRLNYCTSELKRFQTLCILYERHWASDMGEEEEENSRTTNRGMAVSGTMREGGEWNMERGIMTLYGENDEEKGE